MLKNDTFKQCAQVVLMSLCHQQARSHTGGGGRACLELRDTAGAGGQAHL